MEGGGGLLYTRKYLEIPPSREDKMGKHEIKVKKPHKEVAVE